MRNRFLPQSSLAIFTVVMLVTLVTGLVLSQAPAFAQNFPLPQTTGTGQNIAAQMETYSHSDGATYFSLGLQAPEQRGTMAATENEVALVVCTSGSFTGSVRKDSLEAVQSVLDSLPANTKVKLYALDMEADPLTNGFVATNSAELLAGHGALLRRTPLGATDMKGGLTAVTTDFVKNSTVNSRGTTATNRTILFIGDGNSAAEWVDEAAFASMVKNLADNQITFSSYITGLHKNIGLLGAFANQTGGVIIEDDLLEPSDAGTQLAESVTATVYWPNQTTVTLPKTWEVYPSVLPPIRSDRETVLVGRVAGQMIPGTVSVAATPTSSGKTGVSVPQPSMMSWNVTPTTNTRYPKYNQYLVKVVDKAAKDGGRSLPTAGREWLNRLRTNYLNDQITLQSAAEAAAEFGDTETAKTLALMAAVNDPYTQANPAGQSILTDTSDSAATGGGSKFFGEPSPPPVQRSATFTENVASAMTLRSQGVQAEVNRTIGQADRLRQSDPVAAMQDLKLMLSQIRNDAALAPGEKTEYTMKLENALKETEYQAALSEHRRMETDARLGQIEARQSVTAQLLRNEQKAVQLLQRYQSLMNDRNYLMAEAVALTVKAQIPDSAVPDIAALLARGNSCIDEYYRIRNMRRQGFNDALMQVEKSAIPFSDEPPVVYPDPETWVRLSVARKDKWAKAVDLKGRSPEEQQIMDALDSELVLCPKFELGSTLEDIRDTIQNHYNNHTTKKFEHLLIYFDTKALDEAMVDQTNPISDNILNFRYERLTLRLALKRLLPALDLTYAVKDNVLIITTQDAVKDNYMSARAYAVADLVYQPMSSGGGRGGYGAGFSGGSGAGGSSSGGGGGGSGWGGGGGGGMGGGGGGWGFSIPSSPRDAVRNAAAWDVFNRGVLPDGSNGQFMVAPETDTATVGENTAVTPYERIDYRAADLNNLDTYWDDFFTNNQPDPRAVSQAALELLRRSRLNPEAAKQTVAFLSAALRNGTPEPWMHEVLVVSLKLAKAPKKEIERALMSAVDLCDHPDQLFVVAVAMEESDLPQRALRVYRQTCEMTPGNPYPLYRAYRLAQETEDVEAMQWTAIAAMSQVWDQTWQKTFASAPLLAEQCEKLLRKQGRIAEADAFKQLAMAAATRDCIVEISWPGEAGIDIAVKEPASTVCWYMVPQTASGGVLEKSVARRNVTTGKQTENKITYVCPKGFSGSYEVLVERMWGTIPTGKVLATVTLDAGSDKERTMNHYCDISGDKFLLQFDVADGRRTDSMTDVQMQLATELQTIARVKENLSQVLRTTADPEAMMVQQRASILAATSSTDTSGGIQNSDNYLDGDYGVAPWILRRQGVVGYRPIVSLIEIGASAFGNAVASADRRYVRVAIVPVFNQIADIYQFNTLDGNVTGSGSGNQTTTNSNRN